MKVIFVKQVANHNPGDVKEVANGYARNFLLPRGLAIIATQETLKNLEVSLEERRKKEEKEILKIEELKDKIEGKQIKIKVKVGPRNIFGSVTKKEIVEALKKEEISIEKQNIELEKPIKKLGEFSVPIKLSPNQKAYAKIKVEGKNG